MQLFLDIYVQWQLCGYIVKNIMAGGLAAA